MLLDLRELLRRRELLWVWSRREINVRYKQTVLGAAWAVLQPLALMAVLVALSTFLDGIPSGGVPYPPFYYAAALPWTLFASAVSFASLSLVNNLNLVAKAAFPKEILPIGAVVAALFDFMVASSVFLLMVVFYRLPVGVTVAWVPLLIALEVTLVLGVALLCSALVLAFRDLRFVIPLGLQILLFLTPVIYPLSAVPGAARPFFVLNPMVTVVDSFRRVLLYGQAPVAGALTWAAVASLVLLVAGYGYFKRAEARFADIL